MKKLKATLMDPFSGGIGLKLYSDRAYRLLSGLVSMGHLTVSMPGWGGRSSIQPSVYRPVIDLFYDFFALGPFVRRCYDGEVAFTYANLQHWDPRTCAYVRTGQTKSALEQEVKICRGNFCNSLKHLINGMSRTYPLDDKIFFKPGSSFCFTLLELKVLHSYLKTGAWQRCEVNDSLARGLIGKPFDMLTAQRCKQALEELLKLTVEYKQAYDKRATDDEKASIKARMTNLLFTHFHKREAKLFLSEIVRYGIEDNIY